MQEFIDIILPTTITDSEGFSVNRDEILASIRAYKEERHGSTRWLNMASFSDATVLFKFRKIPDLEITTKMIIVCSSGRYNITSVENVKGKNMYVEVYAKEVKASGGWFDTAKATIKMPEEFLLKLSKLGNKTDEIISDALEVGGKIVLSEVKSNLKSIIGKNTKYKSKSTGKLISSLGLSPIKLDKNNNYNVKVGFSEPHDKNTSNAMIANIIEYGKSGQPPKPFLKPAKQKSRKPCINAMKAKIESEIQKIWAFYLN